MPAEETCCYKECSLVLLIQRRHDRPLHPCLNFILKQRSVSPGERPRLTVIDEFLKLHCRHISETGKNIICYIKYGCHRVTPPFAILRGLPSWLFLFYVHD